MESFTNMFPLVLYALYEECQPPAGQLVVGHYASATTHNKHNTITYRPHSHGTNVLFLRLVANQGSLELSLQDLLDALKPLYVACSYNPLPDL